MSLRTISEPIHAFGNAASATIPVVASLPGVTISIHKLLLTASAATNVTIQDSSGAALSQAFPMSGSKVLIVDENDNGDPQWTTAAGLGVQLAQSGAATIGFDVYYLGGPFSGSTPVHVSVFVPTTWNPSDKNGTIALSNGNLTLTPSGQGGVRSVQSLTVGKTYSEYTFVGPTNISSSAIGVANSSAFMTTAITTGINVAICNGAGAIAVNGTAQTGVGAFAVGGVCCVAVDVGASLIWFRNGAAGNWNGSGTANPATGVGGYSLSTLAAGAATLYAYGGGTITNATPVTANFGATAFIGTVPAGFTAGWGVLQ